MLDMKSAGSTPEVRLVAQGPRYTADVLKQAFGGISAVRQSAQPLGAALTNAALELDDRAVAEAADHFRVNEPHLWQGGWETARDSLTGDRRFPSQSEADHYLAREVARLGAAIGLEGDGLEAFTEAVFGRSALAQRDKWQHRQDYRQRTVKSACANVVSAAMVSQGIGAATAIPDWQLKGDVRAARFARDLYRGRLVFVRSVGKWLRWSTEHLRWVWCELGEEVELVTMAVIQLYRQACSQAQQMEGDAGKRLIGEVTVLQTAYRIHAILDLLKSIEGMSIKPEGLDSHPTLLGVRNGVVDLATGNLLPNRPELFITKHIDVDFNPKATAQRWERFLSELFQGDEATVEAVHRLVGMTAAGNSGEELMIFGVGTGANGKSLFSNVLVNNFGPYATTAPPTILAARRSDDHGARPDIAMLAGSRLVSINELPGGMTLDETVVKQLAGREPISARFLHQGFFTFVPMFSVWVRTNHKPIIKGTDNGIWRRIAILPFRRTFTPEEQDPKLEEKLMAEREGILAWMVQGAMKYLQSGVRLSPAMKAEVAQYREDSDVLGEFLADKTEAGTTYEVKQGELFGYFKMWCENNGFRCPTKRTFTAQLEDRNFRQRKSGGDRYYVGLRLRGGGLWGLDRLDRI